MVQTSVGAKCPSCARHTGRTAGHVKPIYYARAIGAGLAAGIFGGILLGFVARMVPFGSIILTFLAAMGMGEIISRAARRNTGRILQLISGTSAALMFLFAGFLTGFNPVTWLMAALGVFLATIRLKD